MLTPVPSLQILTFCDPPELNATDASRSAGLLSFLSPKFFFSCLVTTLILYFVQDVVTKFAQHHLGEIQRAKIEKMYGRLK